MPGRDRYIWGLINEHDHRCDQNLHPLVIKKTEFSKKEFGEKQKTGGKSVL